MKITKQHIIDFLVSMITVYGVYLGTTNLWGAVVYQIAMFCWWCVIYNNRAWGLIPGQILFTVIGVWNIYYAIWK